ncbi:MAG TPA: ATP-binding protein [Hanamia sp.]
MIDNIVGRVDEKALLQNILKSGEPELIAMYGRRRVGKTFLIRNVFEQQLVFEFSGIHNATLGQQLENFSQIMTAASKSLPLATPASWLQAFKMLERFLSPLIKSQRTVMFFDEFPWIHTPRSGFMQAFENFWNTWASKQNNLIVVICGSAASWMIQKVINNRGGLHNRVTRKIRLLPFTIEETEVFLRKRKINLDRYQILQLYMVMGGIPHYLKEIRRGESSLQAIDRICFTKDGLLNGEFNNLYQSLFDGAGNHISVIRTLTKKRMGLTRKEIIKICKLTSGGGTTQLLEELSESGFITPYIPFDRTAKDSIYKLMDEYSLFYIKFIENTKSGGKGTWAKFSGLSSWKSWSGIAFESICMKHILQIKKAIGIESVYTETSTWRYRSQKDEQGAQIDLLIDRQDMCINICEIKFSISEYVINKKYAKELESKIKVFRDNTQTRKTLFLTMVTTYGIKNAGNYTGFIQNEITMDQLFEQV